MQACHLSAVYIYIYLFYFLYVPTHHADVPHGARSNTARHAYHSCRFQLSPASFATRWHTPRTNDTQRGVTGGGGALFANLLLLFLFVLHRVPPRNRHELFCLFFTCVGAGVGPPPSLHEMPFSLLIFPFPFFPLSA